MMRGYVTFLLVFAGIAIVLTTISLTTQNKINHAKSIELEKIYYKELDIKNTLLDLAKQGATKGVKEYIAEELAKAIITEKPPQFDREEMEKRAQAGAYEEMKKISTFDFDEFDVKMWCGSFSEQELAQVTTDSYRTKKAQLCSNCYEISDVVCKDYVKANIVELNEDDPLNSIITVEFGKSRIGSADLIGVSLYSNEIASSVYIPYGVKR